MLRRAARINRDGVATVCDGRRRTWGEVEPDRPRFVPGRSGSVM